MLFIPYAAPQPMGEMDEQRIRDVLQRMDSLLDIHWYRHAFFNEKVKAFEGRYALVCKWPQNDKRWELVQTGEMDGAEAVDIIGWFTKDRQDATSTPVEQEAIENLALELLGSIDATRFPIKERLLGIAEKNVKARRTRRDSVMDEAHDDFSSWWWHKQPKEMVLSDFEVPTKEETENAQSRTDAGSPTPAKSRARKVGTGTRARSRGRRAKG